METKLKIQINSHLATMHSPHMHHTTPNRIRILQCTILLELKTFNVLYEIECKKMPKTKCAIAKHFAK